MTTEEREARRTYWESLPEWQRRELDRQQAKAAALDPNYGSATAARARKRMARVDAMPREMREVVYEFGLDVVQEFLNHRVTNAKSVRHLIATVLALDCNGQNRFAKNSPASRGDNMMNKIARDFDDDDTVYSIARHAS